MTSYGNSIEPLPIGCHGAEHDQITEATSSPAPFAYGNLFTSIVRPTTALSLKLPDQRLLSGFGNSLHFVHWDGLQDLTFVPNDANTLINGTSANLVFGLGTGGVILVVGTRDTWRINRISP